MCASPSITAALSSSAGNDGATVVHDPATLSGATADAAGTVRYSVYSDNACTAKVADAGTVSVVNGAAPDSNSVTFNSTDTYHWEASYSGDSSNNATTSICTDEQS